MSSATSPRTWLGFLFGHAEAIRTLAATRGLWLAGVALVGLTSVARNHDQTWIGEAPLKWTVGNLGFSLVSGTLLWVWVRLMLLRQISEPGPRAGESWRQFLGLFWATAPVAWLYALPVEQFLDSLPAARANVTLLAVVSLWRVLLMARVIAVLHRVPYWGALAWTLSAACVEVNAIYLFGGGLERRILAGMGGLRNSPEEQVLLGALATVSNGALFLFLPALIVGFFARDDRTFAPGPLPVAGRLPWRGLAGLAVGWALVAVPGQLQVRRNAQLDALVEAGRYREALEHLAAHGPQAYAPSRQLAPKAYELTVFDQLPGLIGALRAEDPPWVHAHLLARWEIVCRHLGYQPVKEGTMAPVDEAEVGHRALYLPRQMGPADWLAVLEGLERWEDGRQWLRRNGAVFRQARAQLEEQKKEPRSPAAEPAWREALEKLDARVRVLP